MVVSWLSWPPQRMQNVCCQLCYGRPGDCVLASTWFLRAWVSTNPAGNYDDSFHLLSFPLGYTTSPSTKKKWPHAKKPSKFFKVTTLKCTSADANISREIGRTGQINNQHRRCFTTSSTILTHQTVTSYYKVIAIVAQTTSLRMSD